MPKSVEKTLLAEHVMSSILPQQEEAAFLRSILEIIAIEQVLEKEKIRLTACDDFNLMDAFGMLDLEGSGILTVEQLYRVLLALDLNLVIDDCKLFFRRHNQEQDGRLKYS